MILKKRLLFTLLFFPFFVFAQNNLVAPFYHGVASGDPLADAVIIWTRVAPIINSKNITGKWLVATDVAMKNVVQNGDFQTDVTKDYTVKIDVQRLNSNTYYYYQFEALGKKSIIGRTKTAPKANDSNRLRFAVVSCNNYQHGYFNGFRAIANQHDLDAVIHLGDYIYEVGEGQYDNKTLNREISPITEIVDLHDYRMRYGQYRLDEDFIKIHQQHPFICIWDDHETANDSHKNGARNHQSHEGNWEDRKAAAKQAYFEWLPIRNHPQQKINRILKYGELADLILLDTRLEARDKQPNNMYTPNYMDSSRVMLGKQQREWLFDALENSTAKWKLIGQQVIFSELNVGFANPLDRLKTENYLLDIWDGYPVERLKIMEHLKQQELENVVFLTGDFHSSFAFEVTANPMLETIYNSESSEGAVAIEFVTPSITSANFDEKIPRYFSRKLEECLNKPCRGFPFFHNKNPNPHIKYTDLDRHGFLILDITETATQANFYYVNSINKITDLYSFDAGLKANSGSYHLEYSDENPTKQPVEAAPAFENKSQQGYFISAIYQTEEDIYCQLIIRDKANVCITLKSIDSDKIIFNNCNLKDREIHTIRFSKLDLQKGNYQLFAIAKNKNGISPYYFEVK